MTTTCVPGTCAGVGGNPCIQFFHSYGDDNCEPCLDLGGPISTCVLSTTVENLFHNIGPNLTRLGHEDYRCFYVMNTSMTDTIRNAIIYMTGTRGGTYHALGVFLQNAVQQVVVAGANPPNDGDFFECSIPSPGFGVSGWIPNFVVNYSQNITEWVGNFQTALRTVEGMPEVVVTVEGTIPNVIFTINYGGHSTRNIGDKGSSDHSRWDQAANHFIPLIEISINSLTNCTVTPVPVLNGSPVNTVAEYITTELTPPIVPIFDYYFRGNPIRIGDLRPQEFLPIWIRRTLPIPTNLNGPLANSTHTALLLESFTINVEGSYP